MQLSSSPERNTEGPENVVIHSPEAKAEEGPSADEYEPKFKHTQEDLKYMFGIHVEHEDDLTTPETKKKMYDKAVDDFLQGNPFSLEYFFEEDLLTPQYIKESDLPRLRKAASGMAYSMRHLARRERSKELFVQAGILTKEETDEITRLGNQINS